MFKALIRCSSSSRAAVLAVESVPFKASIIACLSIILVVRPGLIRENCTSTGTKRAINN